MRFEIYRQQNQSEQCWHWRLIDENGETIAYSEKPSYKGSTIASIKRIRQEVLTAVICDGKKLEEQGKGWRIEYHGKDKNGQCSWCLFADDNEKIASGILVSEGDVKINLENICKGMGKANITWENSEDDPDHQAKQDDRTETKGIPGS